MLSHPPNQQGFEVFFKAPTEDIADPVPDPVAHPHCSMPNTPFAPPSTPVHVAPPPYGSFPFGYASYAPPYMPYPPFGSPYPPNPHAPAPARPSMSPTWPNLHESSSDPSDPEEPNPYPEMMVFMETLATLYPKHNLDHHVKVSETKGFCTLMSSRAYRYGTLLVSAWLP